MADTTSMSVISTLAPAAVAPIANVVTNSSGSAPRGADSGTAQSSHAQGVLTSQAAVVHLASAEGKSRAASNGMEGRRVDAGFEKQEAKERFSSKGKEEEGSSNFSRGKIDVEA